MFVSPANIWREMSHRIWKLQSKRGLREKSIKDNEENLERFVGLLRSNPPGPQPQFEVDMVSEYR